MRSRKVYTVARHEYKVTVRRPGFIVFTALVPALGVLALLIVGWTTRGVAPQVAQLFGGLERPIGVVDESGDFSPILPSFRQDFQLYTNAETAFRDADQGKLRAVLIIPSDYVTTGTLYFYSRGGAFTQAALADSHQLRAFLSAHLSRRWVPEAVLQRLTRPLVHLLPVKEAAEATSPMATALKFALPYALALLLTISIFSGSGYLLLGLAAEKTNRLVEIILSSVTPMEWFAGKVLGLGAAGLTQVLIWMLSTLALSGGSVLLLAFAVPSLPWTTWLLMIGYYILGYTLYALLQAGVGALGTTLRETQQLAGILFLIALLPLMLFGLLLAAPNAPFVRALSWFPLTAPTMMIMRLALMDVPPVDVIVSLGLLLASIPAAAWAGAKLFRMGILIYGKRPSLSEIWRALRAA